MISSFRKLDGLSVTDNNRLNFTAFFSVVGYFSLAHLQLGLLSLTIQMLAVQRTSHAQSTLDNNVEVVTQFTAQICRLQQPAVQTGRNSFFPLFQFFGKVGLGQNDLVDRRRIEAAKLGIRLDWDDTRVCAQHLQFQDSDNSISKQDLNDYKRCAASAWRPEEYPKIAKWVFANEESWNGLMVAIENQDHFFEPFLLTRPELEFPYYFSDVPLLNYRLLEFATIRYNLSLGERNYPKAWNEVYNIFLIGRLIPQCPSANEVMAAQNIRQVGCRLALDLAGRASSSLEPTFLNRIVRIGTIPRYAAAIETLENYQRKDWIDSFVKSSGVIETSFHDHVDVDLAVKDFLLQKGCNRDELYTLIDSEFDKVVITHQLKPASKRIFASIELDQRNQAFDRQVIANIIDRNRELGLNPQEIAEVLAPMAISNRVLSTLESKVELYEKLVLITLAIVTYSNRHGDFPKELGVLWPEILAEPVLDPISGADFGYSVHDIGFTIGFERLRDSADSFIDSGEYRFSMFEK